MKVPSTLHKQKITILSRLIKESSLTLEEALLLLQKEEEIEQAPAAPSWTPGMGTAASPWIQPYTGNPYSPFSGTIPLNGNGTFVTTTAVPFTNTTTVNNTSTYTAQTPVLNELEKL